MHAGEESDNGVVAMKQPNNNGRPRGGQPEAEAVEPSPLAEENAAQPNVGRTQSRETTSSGLSRVRQAAREGKQQRFTALLHHLSVDLLRESYYALKRAAAPGVDGLRWQEYETGLEQRLEELHSRVHRGAYHAQPSRRVYIPKSDGRQRPLGIAALEDKIVQQAVVSILNPIYEVDFVGFSYGFRPGRNPHQALDALSVGLTRKKVNWVLDADIRGFLDTASYCPLVHES
jgi:retron-type reverse transcriptase